MFKFEKLDDRDIMGSVGKHVTVRSGNVPQEFLQEFLATRKPKTTNYEIPSTVAVEHQTTKLTFSFKNFCKSYT